MEEITMRHHYIASGPRSGDCGHKHRTGAAADACVSKHARKIAPRTCDRAVYVVDDSGTRTFDSRYPQTYVVPPRPAPEEVNETMLVRRSPADLAPIEKIMIPPRPECA